MAGKEEDKVNVNLNEENLLKRRQRMLILLTPSRTSNYLTHLHRPQLRYLALMLQKADANALDYIFKCRHVQKRGEVIWCVNAGSG